MVSNTLKAGKETKRIKNKTFLLIIPTLFPFLFLSLLCEGYRYHHFNYVAGLKLSYIQIGLIIIFWSWIFLIRKDYQLQEKFIAKLAHITAVGAGITLLLLFIFWCDVLREERLHWIGRRMISQKMFFHFFHPTDFIPICLTILVSAGARIYFKNRSLNTQNVDETTGCFGTAKWATDQDLAGKGAYQSETGGLFGKDSDGRWLYGPMKNRIVIAAPGGGKSAGIVIPILLTEDRPVFVNDIRGELWAVTARHRAYGFGRKRKVIAIDPFQILQQKEYREGKSEELLITTQINPLDYIHRDGSERDRDINAIVTSLVVHEGDWNRHWDDNAEILLSGLIDYLLIKEKKEEQEEEEARKENQEKQEKKENQKQENQIVNLLRLLEYMTKDAVEMSKLLNNMSQLQGYAAGAAGQLLKTAPEERGSIYSTTYRQLKWLVDTNMQKTFERSTVDLRDFIRGDMDIFIVLPEDQVVFHQRVFRLVFTLVTQLLSQAPISQLPKKELLFILDELGQYGYCRDVERAIEILRARKAIIWSVFQGYGQIKLYRKPDLFTNAEIKQVFDVDDEETMTWIQGLGGSTTIQSKAISMHRGKARQTYQVWGGTLSQGAGENVQEMRTDLIHRNEIRELSKEDQLVFIKGWKVIRCQKLLYYQEPAFFGKYDQNPFFQWQQYENGTH